MFRAYDIRGEVGVEVNPDTFRALGRAYATHMTRLLERAPRLVLGRDLRPSSAELSAAVAEGLQSSGAEVLDLGEAPTPVVYFAIDAWEADGGLGVTASHKPPQFNGLKVRRGSGPFYGEDLQKLYRLVREEDFLSAPGSYAQREVWPEYFATATGELPAGAARGMKVVLDLGNGCGVFNARRLLEHLECELLPLFEEPDGSFPHRPPDPLTPEGIRLCAEEVRRSGADLGLAIDADGDRIAVVDHTGEMIWPDRYVVPLCRQALASGPAAFVTEVRCTRALLEDVHNRGGTVQMTACGYPFILAGMAETDAVLGFETSGHCYFGNPYLKYDDAAFGAARLLESLAQSGETMRDLVASLPPYYTAPEHREDCSDETKFAVVEAVAAHYRETHETLEVDGARIEFPDGWGLIRASNTGEELVMRWEGRTEAARDQIGADLLEQVHAALDRCRPPS
jgi:phosphomannomutase